MISIPMTLLITATLGSVLAGLTCSIAGVFVVRLNMASIGFCMSHAAFAGAAFGVLIEVDPLLTALLFASIAAVLLSPVASRAKLNTDVVIGIIFSLMIALAFIFLNLSPGEAASGAALRILWGSIFAVSEFDVLYLALLSVAIISFVILFYKEILALLFNQKLAKAAGVNTYVFMLVIVFITGLAVSLSLKLVGGLLVYALIINPTSTAYQYFWDLRKIMVFSPLVGVASCLAGFLFSLETDFPVGASIVIVSALILAVSITVSPKRRISKKSRASAA
ncbi:MAG: metal ABC transporter permease [Methanobacteriota archaeon]|nr:MAG: metal ABC transporter permease [Euryarchaeota archaeon]